MRHDTGLCNSESTDVRTDERSFDFAQDDTLVKMRCERSASSMESRQACVILYKPVQGLSAKGA